MHYNICSEFQRALITRTHESIINDKDCLWRIFPSDIGDGLNIYQFHHWISRCFHPKQLSVGLDSALHAGDVTSIDESYLDAKIGRTQTKVSIGASVNIVKADYMVTSFEQMSYVCLST